MPIADEQNRLLSSPFRSQLLPEPAQKVQTGLPLFERFNGLWLALLAERRQPAYVNDTTLAIFLGH